MSAPARLVLLTEQTRAWERGGRDTVFSGVRRYSRLTKKELISALKDGDNRSESRSEGLSSSGGQHEERPGQTLVTRDHDVIRQWAEARGANTAE